MQFPITEIIGCSLIFEYFELLKNTKFIFKIAQMPFAILYANKKGHLLCIPTYITQDFSFLK